MAHPYRCRDARRRLAAVQRHPVLNGVEVLEVLDHEAPPGIPRQRTLLVRCVKDVPGAFSGDHVRIEGGRRRDPRLNPVRVQWARKASEVAAGPTGGGLTSADQAFFPTLPEPERVLVVRTDRPGDLSTYVLRLTRSAADDRPPVDFDPVLSEVHFSFKVDCPSDFDCLAAGACPPERLPEPALDYLAKDYESFRRLLLDRLAVTMPGWTERSPADVGVVLVELLAYVADHLSYYQDAVATEAYLGTARRRSSVRRHARLLDYAMHDGCNARAWVAVEAAPGAEQVLPAGTVVLTGPPVADVRVSRDGMEAAIAAGATAFQTLHDGRLSNARNRIEFHTWGQLRCCLPRGATRATLRGAAEQLGLRAGDVLIFEEVRGTSGRPEDADHSHRHAVRLDAPPVPETDPVTTTPVLSISWHEEDALPFPLCLDQFPEPGGLTTGASVARGNVVLADHGFEVIEMLPAVPDAGRYRPALSRPGLTFRMPYRDTEARRTPAATATAVDLRRTEPDIELMEQRQPWRPQRDLLGSDRFAAEFVVETEADGRSVLRFGDDVLGRRPSPGAAFVARYRVGVGTVGNVGPESLRRVVTDLTMIEAVRNPLPAVGGTDAEEPEEVRQYAPTAFRTQERAVTDEDYAHMLERRGEVHRASARRRWTGSWYTEFVVVDPRGGERPDPAFRQSLVDYLEGYRMAGRDVKVDPPVYVPLDVAFTVCVASGYLRSDVRRALLEAFSNGVLPDGRRGFFHPDNFSFGQPLYLSQVVATAMGVPGVRWVDTEDSPSKPNRFRRWGEDAHGEWAQGWIDIAPLEIVRLDNDPNAPENGRLELYVRGGR